MTASEPITLREYVILSGILGTTDLVRAWRWVDASAQVVELPDPLLGALAHTPDGAFSAQVESYVRTWTRMLQAASAQPVAPSRNSRKVNRLQKEAREVCDAALASLLGTAWLSALLPVDDALDGPAEPLLQAVEQLVRSGIQTVAAKPEFADRIAEWAVRDAVSFGVALSKLGSLVSVLQGAELRRTIVLGKESVALGAAVTKPVLQFLGRPGLMASAARHETFFEGAHDVLALAASAGQQPELLEAAVRVLAAGVRWADSQNDDEAHAAWEGRLEAFVAVHLPLPEHPDTLALIRAARQTTADWNTERYQLLAPPTAWIPPLDHASADARWRAACPGAWDALATDPALASQRLAEWIRDRVDDANQAMHPAAIEAVFAMAQFGDAVSRQALESIVGHPNCSYLSQPVRAAIRAAETAPNEEGYPELARRWLLRAQSDDAGAGGGPPSQ